MSTDSDNCPICFENLEITSTLLCKHVLCTKCLLTCIRLKHDKCPICRTDIFDGIVQPTYESIVTGQSTIVIQNYGSLNDITELFGMPRYEEFIEDNDIPQQIEPIFNIQDEIQ